MIREFTIYIISITILWIIGKILQRVLKRPGVNKGNLNTRRWFNRY